MDRPKRNKEKMIPPNTKFLIQREEPKPVNLATLTPTERVNAILFDITCKKCIRIGGCHYERIPCDYKKRFKKLLQALTCDEQMRYYRNCETKTFEEIKNDFSNIINIMEN